MLWLQQVAASHLPKKEGSGQRERTLFYIPTSLLGIAFSLLLFHVFYSLLIYIPTSLLDL